MRSVAVVTSSRADYSHLYWVLHELRADPRIVARLTVIGAHLSPEFGCTIDKILADGFDVHARIETLLSSDSDVAMAKSIGIATMGLADSLGRDRPDLLLLVADRYEMLAPASAALALRIPIAHIEGGEVSEGAIDQAVRDALTKMSHVHFTPTERSRQRVLALGEESWRVHRTGAPSLDHLRRSVIPNRAQLETDLGVSLEPPPLVVAYHPVTLARETTRETEALFTALHSVQRPIVFCFPNADSGSRRIIARARAFCGRRTDAHLFVDIGAVAYWGLLRVAVAMVGNSSSGIMEAPALELPVVNVGLRQQGRERAANIVDVAPRAEAILDGVRKALDEDFRRSLSGMFNPYGDGRAAERIVSIMAQLELGERLLIKRVAQETV